MGAWGAGNFENDDALDWIAELEESSGMAAIEAALRVVVEWGAEYLDAPEACRALAAAEVVAALQGHPPPDLPDGAAAWVSQHAAVDGSTLAALALTAIARTRANSELAELWEETDEAAAWGAVVDGLVSRIQAAQ